MTRVNKIVISQIDGDVNARNEPNTYSYTSDGILVRQDEDRVGRAVVGPGVLYGANKDSADESGLNTVKLIPEEDLGTDQYLIIEPTSPNHIHIRAGGTQDASNADLILGGENTNVSISDTQDRIILKSASGEYLGTASSENQIATIGDLEEVVSPNDVTFTVAGGTLETQPTFTGAPLFTGSYVKTGPVLHFQIQVDMDNILTFGTGQYYVELPFNAKYAYQLKNGCLQDISTGNQFAIGGHVAAGEKRVYLNYIGSNGQDEVFDFNSPVTLNVADNFHIAGDYIVNEDYVWHTLS
jgi:hypothetical protein